MKRRFALKAAAPPWPRRASSACPPSPPTRSRSASCTRSPARWRSARRRCKDVVLMTIDEINAKGGVLGKKIEPVVVDPASNWPLFAEKAQRAAHAGQGRRRPSAAGPRSPASRCCRSSRSCNGLLFYPVQYEGEELVEERLLHRRGAEPAGDPGGRVPDEQGGRRRQALLPARHRLRLPAHDQQDPALLPALARASPTTTSWRSTRRSATATTRPSSPRSRSSRRAARRRRSSRRSTATRTCRSTRSSPTRA